jgi:(1->4)-alpha-D-glucan 1-alpha-D-glucosylmutase
LSLHLNLLAESNRYAKDASPHELHAALMEVTACLPAYRTYTRSFRIRPQDLLHIEQAFREAKRRNPGWNETVWNFVRRVLLLDCPANLAAEERARWKQFVHRWQQFSAPVMAKGKEDTAFYIYNRLISMNEVGGQDQPWPVEHFHCFAKARAKSWPHSLNAGTTHDTKRGEDVRARIHVLAEMPELWMRSVKRWQRWNARCKRVLNGSSVPGANEEYFIYQTLVGAWPLDPDETGEFQERLQNVLVKSWREAKLYTSWSKPDKDYEGAVAEFVATILTPAAENPFLPDFLRFQRRVAASGACLSLAQTLLRLVSPGVPDIYNGAELWEFSLVDPDNRRAVDFGKRQALLATLANRDISILLQNWQCGSVKQYVIQRTLTFRRDHAEVFRHGEYVPLEAVGKHASHVIAFARHSGMAWMIAVAPRFAAKLAKSPKPSIGRGSLAGTDLGFPPTAPRRWSNLFTGERLEVSGAGRLALAEILGRFPIALLTALPD